MKCQAAQFWLLQAESLRPKAWPTDIGKHVDGCAACAKFARDLRELEDQWREQPLPAGTKAKSAFLKTLRQTEPAKPAEQPLLLKARRLMRKPLSWAAAAAMFLLVIGGFAAMLMSPGKTEASSEVVDRLIDWNLEMTAADPKERKRLLDENEAALRQDFQKAKPKLTPEQRELGERLLADGAWMAANDDPLEESKRVGGLADTLSDMSKANLGRKDREREREHCELLFMKVMHFGVHPNVERVNKLKPPDPKGQPKMGFGPPMTPQQFVERQNEIRRQYEMLHKKGFSFRPPFGHRR